MSNLFINNFIIDDIPEYDTEEFYSNRYFFKLEKNLKKNIHPYTNPVYSKNFEQYLIRFTLNEYNNIPFNSKNTDKYKFFVEKMKSFAINYSNYNNLIEIINGINLGYFVKEGDYNSFYLHNINKNSIYQTIIKLYLNLDISGNSYLSFFSQSDIRLSKVVHEFYSDFICVLNEEVLFWETTNNKKISNEFFSKKKIQGWESRKYICKNEKTVFFSLGIFINPDLFGFFKKIILLSENTLRKRLNIPEKGKKWVSQSILFEKIKFAYPGYEVLSEASPDWLGLMRLDIYIPKLKIAIEYQGEQHFRPIEIFGGKEGFEKTRLRDRKKFELCTLNGVRLFYIKSGYDFEELLREIDDLKIKLI